MSQHTPRVVYAQSPDLWPFHSRINGAYHVIDWTHHQQSMYLQSYHRRTVVDLADHVFSCVSKGFNRLAKAYPQAEQLNNTDMLCQRIIQLTSNTALKLSESDSDCVTYRVPTEPDLKLAQAA
ncbi:hypothetical protein [Poriferisphaera sp. WC338]|uniref:hypothetical protein n=1 Tax=Poriferisphaera sp. WC338 TaxID=3425129 RepID=UPI003D81C4BB